MKTIGADPVGFENLSAEELGADSWLEIVKPPRSDVKKKRTKKTPTKPKAKPKAQPAPVGSLLGFDAVKNKEPIKPSKLIDDTSTE